MEYLTWPGQNQTGKLEIQKVEILQRVVVQGFMKARFVPGDHVALDRFHKHPDGTVTEIPNEEYYGFD